MFIKSIRVKITFWYMLVLALTLSLFSVILYQNFRQKLIAGLDDLLQSRAEGIASSIDTYWEVERLEAQRDGMIVYTFSKIDNLNFIKIAQRWVEEQSNDPNLTGIIVQVFDTKGSLVASTKKIPSITALPGEDIRSILKNVSRFSVVDVKLVSKKPEPFREFALPVVENNKVAYIVRVLSPLDSVYSALGDLRIILFILLPLTVILTGVIGMFLAKVALNPVDKIIHTIHQITAENMKLRVVIPDTKDEIRRLADTFNEMLGRLDGAFSSQRQFIEDLTHELKTPLAILKGELEVTLKKIRSPQEYDLVLRSSLEEVDRISKIVADLLVLARFDSKAISLDLISIDLAALVEEVAKDVKILPAQKDIGFEFSMEEKLLIRGDEGKLKRLLLNILENAVKYTPSKGRVSIRAFGDSGFAKIVVADTGIGIPPRELPYIFDRFYRVDKSRHHPGFGLGLSIAKSIAEAHHGKIEVESSLGVGSVFTIFLPIVL